VKIHHLDAQAALASLNTAADGLSAAEVVRRLAEFGPNRVEKVTGVPLPLRFLKEFTHLFALILWLAAGLAFVAELADPGKGMATLGFAILGVILVNGLFSFWQEYRAERAGEAVAAQGAGNARRAGGRNCRRRTGARGYCAAGRGRRHPRRLPADCSLRRARQHRHPHR
jgi:magnesium-transporting ATPase (P-type)